MKLFFRIEIAYYILFVIFPNKLTTFVFVTVFLKWSAVTMAVISKETETFHCSKK